MTTFNPHSPGEGWAEIDHGVFRSRYNDGSFLLLVEVQRRRQCQLIFLTYTDHGWGGAADRLDVPISFQQFLKIIEAPAVQIFDHYAELISWLRCD